jgi:glycine oxidase
MPAQGGFVTRSRSHSLDVAVVGGGVIGLAVAWRAATRGLTVAVLERDRAGAGASHVAAGMLAPIAEVTPGEEPLLELGLRSAAGYPAFLDELASAAGVERSVLSDSRCGTLLVARDADEAEALERELALRARLGLAVERLRPTEARRREPGLAPALRLALDVPDDHAIDPRALMAALVSAVRRGGGEVREGAAVRELLLEDDAVGGVRLADGTVVAARQVVVAAGVWSTQLGGIPEGARVPVRPIKGQIMRLHDPAGPGLLTRVIRMGPSYVVPRGDGRYVIGATSEERGFDTTVTAGAAFELLRDASELVPGVSEWVLDEFSAGLRPGTPDNLPAIGPGDVPGLHWAVGHRRGGVLLAPATAELVAAALAGEPADPSAAPFAAQRFAAVGSAAA